MTGESILIFFFVTFSRSFSRSFSSTCILVSSWERCSYSENQNAAALLQSLLRRTQHSRFPPSLASVNYLASPSLDPQLNTLPKENFSLPWTPGGFENIEAAFLEWGLKTEIEHHFPHYCVIEVFIYFFFIWLWGTELKGECYLYL